MIDESLPSSAVSIVKLPSEVDVVSAGSLRDELLASLNRGGVHLIAEASDVKFIDSSGINALVRARERAERLGGSIHVVGSSRALLRVLEITQLDHVMYVLPTIEAAQACVAKPELIHSCRQSGLERS